MSTEHVKSYFDIFGQKITIEEFVNVPRSLHEGSLCPHIRRFLLALFLNFGPIKNFQKLRSLSTHPEINKCMKVFGARVSRSDPVLTAWVPLNTPMSRHRPQHGGRSLITIGTVIALQHWLVQDQFFYFFLQKNKD